jgi:hypothetical protein
MVVVMVGLLIVAVVLVDLKCYCAHFLAQEELCLNKTTPVDVYVSPASRMHYQMAFNLHLVTFWFHLLSATFTMLA